MRGSAQSKQYGPAAIAPDIARLRPGVAAGLLGEGGCVAPASALTGAEDFSFVLEQVPGAFLSLGACPPGTDPQTAPVNHAADAVFDDSVLATGAALYAELAWQRLAAGD